MIPTYKFISDGIFGIDHFHEMLKGENATKHELVDFISSIEEVEDVIVVWKNFEFVDSSSLFSFFCVDIFMITNGFFKLFQYTIMENKGNLSFAILEGMIQPTSNARKGKSDLIGIKSNLIYFYFAND